MLTFSRPAPKTFLSVAALLFALVAALLCGPVATAHAESFPSGYPKMGPSAEGQGGYAVTMGGERSGVHTTLFPVYTAPGKKPNQLAYCIEYTVNARFDSNLSVGGWAQFPGNNRFSKDESVREHVAWIVYNSYPNRSVAELSQTSGITGLTEKDAITATQAAIWSLTDTGALKAVSGVDSATQKRIKALFTYLTGPTNVGRAEVLEPSLSVTATSASGLVGTRVGPLAITSTEDTLALTTTSPYPIVDGAGQPVDLNAVPGNAELYVDVPAGVPAGGAEFAVELTGSRYTGLLVINATKKTHYQTLMIASSDEVKANATAYAAWEDAPVITTTASDASDGDKNLDQDGPVSVIDTVNYSGLIPGREYTVNGELMIRDGETAAGTGILASLAFTPQQANGSVDLTFDIPEGELLDAHIVVFERLFYAGTQIAEHTDITSEAQSVYRPVVKSDDVAPETEETPEEPTDNPPATDVTPDDAPDSEAPVDETPKSSGVLGDEIWASPSDDTVDVEDGSLLAQTGLNGLAAGGIALVLVIGGIAAVVSRKHRA